MVNLRQIADRVGLNFERLVHISARHNQVIATRHRSFIAAHVIGGSIALLVLPVYLAVYGQPKLAEALAFSWFVSPIAIAIFLSWTARYEAAHLISVANLAGLVTYAAAISGGLNSFLIPWIIIIPFEAALSLSRRIVLAGICLACLALLVLFALTHSGMLPEPRMLVGDWRAVTMIGAVSATVYAGGLAVSVHRVHGESERAIRRGEERYRLLAENATDMITRHSANGAVNFASLAAERLIGTPAATLLGDGLLERIYPVDRPAFLTAISRAAQRGTATNVEFRLRDDAKPRGDEAALASSTGTVWLEMRCRPLGAGETELHAGRRQVVAVSRDVTERKAHEAALLRMRNEAEAANRAKSRFLAAMSHELRTPLNAIIGFSDILCEQGMDDLTAEQQHEFPRIIRHSGQRLLGLVDNILDVSRLETGSFEINPQPLDVPDLVCSCHQAMAADAARAGLELCLELQDKMPEITADESACRRILINLVSNAIKFSAPGGRVTLAARFTAAAVILSVEDTGIGMAPEQFSHLAQPFAQVDMSYTRKHEGAGLGLSMVHGVARLHGGSMEIESEPGIGTRVSVILPLKPGTSKNRIAERKVVPLRQPA
ncbi:MAG: PAS domain-containing sensor histidine kinase [Hyphomicrobiales bacterium]|nr:PAS domain-containing sensor histidine kinase [Hyphomicrobiales bacterium]